MILHELTKLRRNLEFHINFPAVRQGTKDQQGGWVGGEAVGLGAFEESGSVQEKVEVGRELACGLHRFVPDAHGAFGACQGVLGCDGVGGDNLQLRADQVNELSR